MQLAPELPQPRPPPNQTLLPKRCVEGATRRPSVELSSQLSLLTPQTRRSQGPSEWVAGHWPSRQLDQGLGVTSDASLCHGAALCNHVLSAPRALSLCLQFFPMSSPSGPSRPVYGEGWRQLLTPQTSRVVSGRCPATRLWQMPCWQVQGLREPHPRQRGTPTVCGQASGARRGGRDR